MNGLISRHYKMILMLLLVLGAAIRLVALGDLPAGLNQDEASAGYEAWALLDSGIDRNGNSWPVLFVSWGSGQNVLYSYLSMPFIALFGLNEWSLRLTAALFGILTTYVFYKIAEKTRGKLFGLAALCVITVNPWHIMISRWALESNLLPGLLLLGICFIILADSDKRYLFGAAAAFGISAYSYGTSFLFLPVFLLSALVIMYVQKNLEWKYFLPAAGLFLILIFPIALCNVRNVLGMGDLRILGMTLPALTETRQTATTVFAGGGLSDMLKNFGSLLKILWAQSDGLPWNSIEIWGLFWGLPGLALCVLGIVRTLIKRKKGEEFLLAALFTSFFASLFISVNINRINMIFLPLIYFQAVGIWELVQILRGKEMAAVLAASAVCGALFLKSYATDFQRDISDPFFDGLGEAIAYASERDAESIYITDQVNSPYIYALFYDPIPPGEFVQEVQYEAPDAAFRRVLSFGHYSFGDDPKDESIQILYKNELTGGENIAAEFGNYVVLEK